MHQHDWILEVLSDLHAYARSNDLPGLARKVEEAALAFRGDTGADSLQRGEPPADTALGPVRLGRAGRPQ